MNVIPAKGPRRGEKYTKSRKRRFEDPVPRVHKRPPLYRTAPASRFNHWQNEACSYFIDKEDAAVAKYYGILAVPVQRHSK
ncbi:hypothetical protein BDV33DRAFT_174271 [Aspergillus novoparasiticus]|uniref:Uncharacterized protein n=1 Tax=Aspergillus novoparasiticus TaxID=986946 RepID=A0A5N6ERZ7_9EURO|nr:hypothetical protein BDV33DRAFT_174271 [Aspergillus novoparasiticus]